MSHIGKVLKELPKEELIEIEEKVLYTLEEDERDFEIIRQGQDYIVQGPAVEKIMRRVNIQDRESMHYLQKCLENAGIFAELKKQGIKEGETVKILDWEFEWYE